MCLYPKLIKNRRYVPNKKNGGVPPQCPDERLLYVTAACGKCMECRQQKQRQWLVRMSEEAYNKKNDRLDARREKADEQRAQGKDPIVTGKQIGRASCRERVSSPV